MLFLSGQALFTPLKLRSEGLVPASATGQRTKDSRPPCDGILRQLRCLRMARCPAGRLAAVAAHRAGVGWGGNVGRWECSKDFCLFSKFRHLFVKLPLEYSFFHMTGRFLMCKYIVCFSPCAKCFHAFYRLCAKCWPHSVLEGVGTPVISCKHRNGQGEPNLQLEGLGNAFLSGMAPGLF